MDARSIGHGGCPVREARADVQAEEALEAKEVPVGCVFVKDGKAIARARNRTNEWRNVCHLLGIADNRPRCMQNLKHSRTCFLITLRRCRPSRYT